MNSARRHNWRAASTRGLSLLELMLAMAITVMVAAAITAMLGAVTSGVGTRRDSRAVMVLAHAAQSRLSAYIGPARCILQVDGPNLAIWLNDDREGGTVHASEVRWLLYDSASGTINVHFVAFPPSWTRAACDLEDSAYPASTNWMSVLANYQAKGWTHSIAIVDNLTDLRVALDHANVTQCRHVLHQLSFDTEAVSGPISAASTIRQQLSPAS